MAQASCCQTAMSFGSIGLYGMVWKQEMSSVAIASASAVLKTISSTINSGKPRKPRLPTPAR